MHLTRTKFKFTGGERGWVGDVPKMQLAVDRIKALRWKPQLGSRESIRIAVKAMLEERLPSQ
jgi:UDP-glucose 4-epimerase